MLYRSIIVVQTSNIESTSNPEEIVKSAPSHNEAAIENEDQPDSDQDQKLASKCIDIIIMYMLTSGHYDQL